LRSVKLAVYTHCSNSFFTQSLFQFKKQVSLQRTILRVPLPYI
jgi:hypothetical protein